MTTTYTARIGASHPLFAAVEDGILEATDPAGISALLAEIGYEGPSLRVLDARGSTVGWASATRWAWTAGAGEIARLKTLYRRAD
jgi:hypothetical protein